jgi:hypothetical protein
MKSISTFFILFFVLAGQAFAQGFYNPTDPSIPERLKVASRSVFEIRTAFFEDFETQSDISVADIRSMSASDIDSAIGRMQLDKKDSQIIRAFINNCKTEEQKMNCPVPLKINSGSSFIAGSGNVLWTNAHVVEKMLNTKAMTNEKSVSDVLRSKDNMPVFIFNKDGEMIFNGLKDAVSFRSVPLETRMTKLGSSFYSVDSDYVAIELPVSLGAPLPIARTISSDNVAVIGYPYCTGCTPQEGQDPLDYASRYPYPNAEDCLEKVTGGSLINTEAWGQLAQVNLQIVQNLNRSTFIGHTADSQHGMSGGPILNLNGEVVGIHAGGKTVNTGKGLNRYSRGVRPPEFNY